MSKKGETRRRLGLDGGAPRSPMPQEAAGEPGHLEPSHRALIVRTAAAGNGVFVEKPLFRGDFSRPSSTP